MVKRNDLVIFTFSCKNSLREVSHNEPWCISSVRMENKPFIISGLTHSEPADTGMF